MGNMNPKVVFLGVPVAQGLVSTHFSRDLSSDAEDGSSRSVLSSKRLSQIARYDAEVLFP